jgi:hypothetical protein
VTKVLLGVIASGPVADAAGPRGGPHILVTNTCHQGVRARVTPPQGTQSV